MQMCLDGRSRRAGKLTRALKVTRSGKNPTNPTCETV